MFNLNKHSFSLLQKKINAKARLMFVDQMQLVWMWMLISHANALTPALWPLLQVMPIVVIKDVQGVNILIFDI